MNYVPTFQKIYWKNWEKNYDKKFVDQSWLFGLTVYQMSNMPQKSYEENMSLDHQNMINHNCLSSWSNKLGVRLTSHTKSVRPWNIINSAFNAIFSSIFISPIPWCFNLWVKWTWTLKWLFFQSYILYFDDHGLSGSRVKGTFLVLFIDPLDFLSNVTATLVCFCFCSWWCSIGLPEVPQHMIHQQAKKKVRPVTQTF